METQTREWSDDEVSKLRTLARTKTIPSIARELGRTAGQVRWMIQKCQLHTKVPWTRPVEEAKRIARYSDEHGCKAAAEHYHLSVDVVKNIRRRVARVVSQRRDSFSPDRLLRLRMSAIKYACTCDRAFEAEDFASFVMLKIVRGAFVDLKMAFADYLRETYGSLRSGDGRIRADANLKMLSIDAFHEDASHDDDVGKDSQTPQIGGLTTDRFFVLRALNDVELGKNERIALVLRLHFGFDDVEIGIVLDVTPSRISQIMKEAIPKIANKYEVD